MQRDTKRILVILFRSCYIGAAVLLVLIIISDIASAYFMRPQHHVFSERHMGTEFRVTIAGELTTARLISQKAFDRAKELDGKLSDYNAESELMRLCDKSGQGPVAVSDDLLNVMIEAQRIAKLSDGAFDVTIGPVVRLWRLARRTRELPAADELAAARSKVGYEKVQIDAVKKTIALTMPGMKLDLGGIAKGFAAQEMVKVLRDNGCPSCLVAAGGDIVAGDAPPFQTGWSVAIAPLVAADSPPTILLANAAISTSGDAEQYVEIGGKRYAHIVDPKTGIGLTGQFAITVMAKDGPTADALATAAAVIGPERGLKLVAGVTGVSGRFVWMDDGKMLPTVIDKLTNFKK